MPKWRLITRIRDPDNGGWIEYTTSTTAPTLNDATQKIARIVYPRRVLLKEAHKVERTYR